MISNIQLTQDSISLLSARGLNSTEINQFGQLMSEAQQHEQGYADYLSGVSKSDLGLIQKANSLAYQIQPENLSKEGSINLLKQPDKSNAVDLNNDGIVEVGIGRTIVFPPVNAPDYVKTAWDKATEGLSQFEAATLELQMHLAIYGFNIDGIQTKTALPPNEQWNTENTDVLFENLRGNLDFRVNLEGWTEYNLMLKDLYTEFEAGLKEGREAVQEQDLSSVYGYSDEVEDDSQNQQTINERTTSEQNSLQTAQDKTLDVIQLLLDAKLGLYRKKLEEIDEKIEAIRQDESLSAEEKQNQIDALEKQKEAILSEAQRRSVEQEKRKAMLAQADNLTEI